MSGRWPRPGSVLSLSAVAVILVVGATYLAFGVVRVDWFTRHSTAVMDLPDAAGLLPHSPVLLSGVKVGAVTSIANSPNGVRVDLRIDGDYPIPRDSSITIEQLSALGEPYLEFRPNHGGGPYLSDGEHVRADSVRLPVSIPEMARTVTTLLDQFDPQTIASLVRTYSQALSGTDDVIPELARSADLLAATLISRAPQIDTLLADAQIPGPEVARVGADMVEAGPRWGEFGTKVKDVVSALEHLLNARPVPDAYTTGTGLLPFLTRLTDYLDKIGPDLRETYPAVQPLFSAATSAVPGIDLSALIDQALHATSPDGGLRLQLDLGGSGR